MLLFVFSAEIVCPGLIITVLLGVGVVTTGGVSQVLTMPPGVGTVAMGSVCIRGTALTIGGTATVGKTCVRMPVSAGCTPAETVFPKDVFPSPVCTKACVREVECDAIPSAVCRGCVPGPETICWARTEECKASGLVADELVAGTVMTGLGRGTADGLGNREKDDRGADNLDKVGATVSELSACPGAPAAKLIVASVEPRTGALGETSAGTPTNLGWDETREGELPGGDVKLLGTLSKADMLVSLGNTELRLFGWTGMTLGVFAGPLAVAYATSGELTAGTHGCLTGDCGKTGA